MLKDFKVLGKNTLIYGLGPVYKIMVGFFLVPLYTAVISTAEFGVYDLLGRMNSLLITVFTFGVQISFLRFFNDYKEEDDQKAVFSSGMMFMIVTSIFFVIPMLFADRISLFLTGSEDYAFAVNLSLTIIILQRMYRLSINYFTVQLQAGRFMAISLSYATMSLILNLVLVLWLDMKLEGILLSTLISLVLFGALTSIYVISKTGFRVRLSILKEMLKFGMPLVPAGIFAFLFMYSDRFILQGYIGKEAGLHQVGIYSLGGKFAGIITMIISWPFMKVWVPFIVKVKDQDNARDIFARAYTYLVFLIFALSLGVAVMAPEIISVFAQSESYYDAVYVIPMLSLAIAFWVSASMFETGIWLEKKTKYKPWIMGITAIIALVCYTSLIGLLSVYAPDYAWIGAAVGYTIACFAHMLHTLYIAQRHYRVPYEFGRVIQLLIISLLVFGGGWLVGTKIELNLVTISLKLLVLAVFPVALLLTGFLRPDERNFLKRNWRRLLKLQKPDSMVP